MYERARKEERSRPRACTLSALLRGARYATAGKNKDSGNYLRAERDGDIHHPRSFEYRGSEEQPTRRRRTERVVSSRRRGRGERSWNEVGKRARKRSEDRWRKGVGRDRFYARLYTGIYTDMRPCGRRSGGKREGKNRLAKR